MNTRIHAHDSVSDELAGTPPGAEADDTLRALWGRWVSERAAGDRERLILHYAPLVKYVAGRLSVGIGTTLDLGDLISYGIFGLIDAIERYDPGLGSAFESYALGRIKGAIIDELRAVDWVPRAVREHARAVQTALAELEARLRRTPTDEELAAHMQITVSRLGELLHQISLTSLIALDDLFVDDHGRHRALAETLHDPHAVDPQRRVEHRELRAALAAAIDKLSDRDRTVIMLYYFEGMTLSQIGDILQVTESRASQMHTKAVLALRAKLSASMR